MCINDLPCSVKHAKVSKYANDTSLGLQSDKISRLIEVLNDDLKSPYLWLKGNILSLNVAKPNHWSFPLDIGKLL